MPLKNIESLTPALDELARALEWVSQDIDDIPFKVVPVIQSQGKRARCTGWFSKDQWSTREGELVAEINFTAEMLNRDPVDIIATARHEIVHMWCDFLQLKDTSTGGRHNKVFAEYAEILGLVVQRPAVDSYGLGYTEPGEELRERIEKEFQPDVAAFNLFRLIKLKPKSDTKTNAYWCACKGMTVRIPAKQELQGECHVCGVTFLKKEEGDERPEATPETEANRERRITRDIEALADALSDVPEHDPRSDHPDDYPLHIHEGDPDQKVWDFLDGTGDDSERSETDESPDADVLPGVSDMPVSEEVVEVAPVEEGGDTDEPPAAPAKRKRTGTTKKS